MNYITFKTLSKKLGNRSKSSIFRDMIKGFPRPIVLNGTNLWSVDAVDQYLQELAEVPYQPKPVAVPRAGKSRGRKKQQIGGSHEK